MSAQGPGQDRLDSSAISARLRSSARTQRARTDARDTAAVDERRWDDDPPPHADPAAAVGAGEPLSLLTQMPDVQGTVVAPYWPHRWEFQALRSQAADMLVMPAEPALYQPAAPEVFVPSCRSLAFLRVLPGRVRALQPTAHAQQE